MQKLCKIRNIQRAIAVFEQKFIACYGLCLNEGMALCSISESENKKLTSGEIGELLGLTLSNTSKVIASVEKKELIKRSLGKTDKRQMYFSLTHKGAALLASMKCETLEPPDIIKELM